MVVYKGREQGINDGTNFLNSPIFSNVKFIHTTKVLNITIQKICTIVDPLFPSFLHHHCVQILYTTNFLRENVFISCP